MTTVIVLYDDCVCEHYVSVRAGTFSDDEKLEIAKSLKAHIDGEEGAHHDDVRTVSFVECQDGDTTLKNIWS